MMIDGKAEALTPAEAFFFEKYHTWRPDAERLKFARSMAAAEKWLAAGVDGRFAEWLVDDEADRSWMEADEDDGRTMYGCIVWHEEGYNTSLWSIDLGADGDDDYKRLVEAELATELMEDAAGRE